MVGIALDFLSSIISRPQAARLFLRGIVLMNGVQAGFLLMLVTLVGCGRESQAAHPAAEGDIPRTAWPESWFHPPRTASEVGLTTFRQSPMLDELVASGELPPVEERLPDDPIVVEPLDGIGTYGGTARLFFAGEQLLNVPEGTLRPGPQLQLTLPNFAARVEYHNDAQTLTGLPPARSQVVRRPPSDSRRLCLLVRSRPHEQKPHTRGVASL